MATAPNPAPADAPLELEARLRRLDWAAAARELDERGHAIFERLLGAAECSELISLYADAAAFRSTVVMERHGYGRGEYKYFGYPLPALVSGLRTNLYRELAPIANRWNASLGIEATYPASLLVPAGLLGDDGLPVKGLAGLLTLLHDGGYDDREIIAWLYRDADLPGRPIDALRENRGAEVKRRAQAMAL